MMSPQLIALEAIALLLMLIALRSRVPMSPLSPVWLVLGAYLLVAILGRYALGLGSAIPGQAFLFQLPVKTLDDTLVWLLMMMIAFAAGAHLHLFVFPAAALPIGFAPSRPYRRGGLLITGAALALLLLITGIGVHKIFYRIEYLTNRQSIIYKVGKLLAPIGVASCGYATLSLAGCGKTIFQGVFGRVNMS